MKNETSEDKNIKVEELNSTKLNENNNIDDGDDKEPFLNFMQFSKIFIISVITSILIVSFLFDNYNALAVLLTSILVVIKVGLVLAYKSIIRAR